MKRLIARARYSTLFVTLMVLILVAPLVARTTGGRALMDLVITIALVSGVRSVEGSKSFAFAAVMAVVAFAVRWSAYVLGGSVHWIGTLTAAVFFLSITIPIIRDVMQADDVDSEHVFGAAAAYLLIGVCWAFFAMSVELVGPGSFTGAGLYDENGRLAISGFMYFSFVTLATLGYGDIVPTSALARSLSITEAVIGQLYIAVLLARLVARQATRKRDEP